MRWRARLNYPCRVTIKCTDIGIANADHLTGDYILGTSEEEVTRLALQHRSWLPYVLECWRSAGITAGNHVLDIGAGPGCASLDLAELVGPTGRVTVVERSHNFIQVIREAIRRRSISNIDLHQMDLMTDEIPPGNYDFSWCRWVATFVTDPALLLRKLAAILRKGSVAIFHEYAQYTTWRLCPRLPLQEEFTRRVTESWRATGGEPDVALFLPSLLFANGFRVRKSAPRVFCIGPNDPMWQWLAVFIDSGLTRLQGLGLVDEQFAIQLRTGLAEREQRPESLMISPLLLEIVAEKVSW
jgi:SAM-dependent methyltransferase